MREIRFLAAITVLLFVVMATFSSSIKPSIPALQLTFSESGFQQITRLWSAEAREKFSMHFLIDFPFLLCYGALGYRMVNKLDMFSALAAARRRRLARVLPAAAIADCVENVFHLFFISGIAPVPAYAYFFAGMAASIKWLLIVGFVAAFLLAYRRRSGSG